MAFRPSEAAGRQVGETSYGHAIRDRLALIAALVALGAGLGALFAILTDRRYEATAEILVTPLPDDPAFAGLGGLTEPQQLETAARLVERREIAQAVATRLGRDSPEDLLDSVDAHPAGESNVVAVEARASNGARAAQIANGFVDELITRRSARFQSVLAARIQRSREALGAIPAHRRDTPRAVLLDQQLARLTPLVGGGDPTLEVVSDAVAPEEPEPPSPWWLVPIGALVGLLVGVLVAVFPLARERRRRRQDDAPAARHEPSQTEQPAATADSASDDEAHRVRDRELDERERRLELRERRLEERERELEARRTRLREQSEAAASREAALTRRATEIETAERAAAAAFVSPPSSPTGPPQPQKGGSWNLIELERLVAERGAHHPDRLEEWEAYLFLLRDHAGPDGNLSSTFDWLVTDVFRDLVENGETSARGKSSTGL